MSAEVCDGLDNDGNGQVDENIDSRVVSVGPPGAQRTLTQSCLNGAWSPEIAPYEPQPETCNAIDDDGDGMTDEGVDVPDVPNASVVCRDGALLVTCRDGWVDDDPDVPGCETPSLGAGPFGALLNPSH